MLADLRYTVRTLRKTPGFALLAVLVLALGIGLNTSIFSVINAVLFAAPKVPAAAELRYVYPRGYGIGYSDFQLLRSDAEVFEGLASAAADTARVGAGVDVRIVHGEQVSANYFDVLGLKAVLGRTFGAQDDQPDAPFTVVISDALWARVFNRDPDVVGRTLRLAYQLKLAEDQFPDFAVIGVMAPEFKGVRSPFEVAEYWVPSRQRVRDHVIGIEVLSIPPIDRAQVGLMFGRLRPGITDRRAQVVFDALGARTEAATLSKELPFSLSVEKSRRVQFPLAPTRGGPVPERLATGLIIIAGVVLLIVGANLAGMLTARGLSRQGEIATRLTLGASRFRIVRQLILESTLLSVVGGAFGLLVAKTMNAAFMAGLPEELGYFRTSVTLSLEVAIDARVLVFAVGATMLTSLFVGSVPARQAWRTNLLANLAGGTAASGRIGRRLGRWIVVPQVALCLALLISAGALARPLLRSMAADPGFAVDQVVYVDFDFVWGGFRKSTKEEDAARYLRRAAAYDRLLEQARMVPGVSSVAIGLTSPISPSRSWLTGRDNFPNAPHVYGSTQCVSLDYFQTMGIRTTEGRVFDSRDTATGSVAVVSRVLADRLFPGQNAVGSFLAWHEPNSNQASKWYEVIGVVNDLRFSLEEATPLMYTPRLQRDSSPAYSLVARGARPPGELIQGLRAAVASADDRMEIHRSGLLAGAVDKLTYPHRLAVTVISLAGLFALFLSAVGIYGVVAYSVSQRMREIGIRATLGASPARLMGLVFREGAGLTTVGVALGIGLGYLCVRLASSYLIAIPGVDMLTLVVVPLVLASTIALACYLPARRAARVDPAVVLRQ